MRRRTWTRGIALAALAALLAVGAVAGRRRLPPQPFGQELLGNGGFESGAFAPWTVEAGSCEVEYGPTFAWADAVGGDYLFYGGDGGQVATCRAAQDVDLVAERFRAATIDGGGVLADASVWLRSWLPAGSFDDQVFLRLRFLDLVGTELASLRTLLAGSDDWVWRRADGLVPPGTRRVRVELESRFRAGADNDGMVDEASLVLESGAAAVPILTKPPMLQDVRTDAMTILWETDGNRAHHVIEWGLAGGSLDRVATGVETTRVDGLHYVHKGVLTGLAPETDYDYRVRSGSATSVVHAFRTAPLATTPYRIAWLADNQNGPTVFSQHVLHMAARNPDLVVVPGDLVQNGNQVAQWGDYWWDPLGISQLAQTTPVVIARGNHDDEHPYSYAYTAVPGNESWYAFSYGNALFVALDTEAPATGTGGEEDPLVFLNAALDSPEAQEAEFRIVFFHRPPFTNLWDPSNVLACLFGSPYTGEAGVRDQWVPVFEQKGVDLVVSGHTHSYQHGVLNGVHYVTVGGAGGAIDDVRGCGGSTFWGFIDTELSQYHYNLMDVSGNLLDWTTYDLSDAVVHSFQIVH